MEKLTDAAEWGWALSMACIGVMTLANQRGILWGVPLLVVFIVSLRAAVYSLVASG